MDNEFISSDFMNLADEINCRPILTELLTPAKSKNSFVCICGNGSGKDDTGAIIKVVAGYERLVCGKCKKYFGNIDIIANYLGLSTRGNDFYEIVKFGCRRFHLTLNEDLYQNTMTDATTGISARSSGISETATVKNELELINADIEKARKSLREFIDSQGGTFRGLTFETLQKHGVGYLDNWQAPKNILTGKTAFPTTRRLIIPTADSNYYNAIMLPTDRNEKNKKLWKQHAGTNPRAFATQFINSKTSKIIIVEGEIDAMSINQVFDYNQTIAIATLGVNPSKDVLADIFQTLDKFFSDRIKPIILILFDNDAAGKENAPKLCTSLIQRGFPAVFDFFSDSEEKLDANEILQLSGNDGLRQATTALFEHNSDNFSAVKKDAVVERHWKNIGNPTCL